MTEKKEVEFFLVINDDGEFQVGITADQAGERLNEDVTSYRIRCVKLTARLALPAIEDGPTIDIPDTAGTTQQIEVEAA